MNAKSIGVVVVWLCSSMANVSSQAEENVFDDLSCRIRIPFASIHMSGSDDDNSFNPGLGVACSPEGGNFYGTTGVYYNSQRNASVFLGGGYERQIWRRDDMFLNLGLELLLVSGYDNTPVLGAPFVTLGKLEHSLQVLVLPTDGGAIAFGYQYAY